MTVNKLSNSEVRLDTQLHLQRCDEGVTRVREIMPVAFELAAPFLDTISSQVRISSECLTASFAAAAALCRSGNPNHPIVQEAAVHIANNDETYRIYTRTRLNPNFYADEDKKRLTDDGFSLENIGVIARCFLTSWGMTSLDQQGFNFIIEEFQKQYQSMKIRTSERFCRDEIPELCKYDKKFYLSISKRFRGILQYTSETLKGDKEIVLAAVKQDGRALQYARETLKGDREIVLEAVKQDGRALKYARETLKGDRKIVLEAVQLGSRALDGVIQLDTHSLAYASETLKDDKEIVLAAVKQDGRALEHASETLKDDKEIVLTAVKQSSRALEYASKTLKDNKEIVLVAIERCWLGLQYASETLKDNKEIILAAVKKNRFALRFASETLKGDKEIILAAETQRADASRRQRERMESCGMVYPRTLEIRLRTD